MPRARSYHKTGVGHPTAPYSVKRLLHKVAARLTETCRYASLFVSLCRSSTVLSTAIPSARPRSGDSPHTISPYKASGKHLLANALAIIHGLAITTEGEFVDGYHSSLLAIAGNPLCLTRFLPDARPRARRGDESAPRRAVLLGEPTRRVRGQARPQAREGQVCDTAGRARSGLVEGGQTGPVRVLIEEVESPRLLV